MGKLNHALARIKEEARTIPNRSFNLDCDLAAKKYDLADLAGDGSVPSVVGKHLTLVGGAANTQPATLKRGDTVASIALGEGVNFSALTERRFWCDAGSSSSEVTVIAGANNQVITVLWSDDDET